MIVVALFIFYLLLEHHEILLEDYTSNDLFWKYIIAFLMMLSGIAFMVFSEIENVEVNK